MALPLVIAVAACVWGIVGDHKQRVSSILIFLVFLLDIIMFATKGNFLLQGEEGQSYLMGNGSMYALIISGVSSVFSVLAWIATPKIVKETSDEIPQVAEIKQQQVEAKYNVMLEEQPEKPLRIRFCQYKGIGSFSIKAHGVHHGLPPGDPFRLHRRIRFKPPA